MKQSFSLRPLLLAILSATPLIILAGCDTLSDWMGVSEDRTGSTVSGQRHPPVLNAEYKAKKPATPAEPPPAVIVPAPQAVPDEAQVAPRKPFAENTHPAQESAHPVQPPSIEAGDMEGAGPVKPVLPAPVLSAPVPQISEPVSSSDYHSAYRPYHAPSAPDDHAAAQPEKETVPAPAQDVNSTAPEKPVENTAPAPSVAPETPADNSAPAPSPASEKPVENAAPVPEKPVENAPPAAPPASDKPVEDTAPSASNANGQVIYEEHAKSEKTPSKPSSSPSFFSWLFGDDNASHDNDKEVAADKAEASKSGYPALSSVPATPQQFKEIKATESEKKEELQDEHTMAQHEKENLDNESPQAASQPETPAQPQPAPTASPAPETVPAGSLPIVHWNPQNAAPANAPVPQAAPEAVPATTPMPSPAEFAPVTPVIINDNKAPSAPSDSGQQQDEAP